MNNNECKVATRNTFSPKEKTIKKGNSKEYKKTVFNMRIDEKKRSLIDKAAEELGIDRTNFVIDAAFERAEKVLLERRVFQLNYIEFDEFEALLDQYNNKENRCIKEILEIQSPWD